MGNCMECFKSSSNTAGTSITRSSIATGSIAQTTNLDCRMIGVNAIERSIYCDRSEETHELLSTRSPLKTANNCDNMRNSFKKSLVLLNGNANIVDDNVKEPMHEVSDNTLNLLFEEYKDPQEDAILSDGVERLCHDLNYQPDEFPILVLAWCLDASQMCRFTKTEFIEGLHKMSADTIDTIRIRLEQTIEILKTDSELFKQLYRFTFRFGLEPDQRILSLDMAIILWRLVFTVYQPELLNRWLYFLEKNPTIRGIPKDTWNMFLNFCEQCDINNYDDTEAWPSLFDDFVDYEKSKINDPNFINNNIASNNNMDDNNQYHNHQQNQCIDLHNFRNIL